MIKVKVEFPKKNDYFYKYMMLDEPKSCMCIGAEVRYNAFKRANHRNSATVNLYFSQNPILAVLD